MASNNNKKKQYKPKNKGKELLYTVAATSFFLFSLIITSVLVIKSIGVYQEYSTLKTQNNTLESQITKIQQIPDERLLQFSQGLERVIPQNINLGELGKAINEGIEKHELRVVRLALTEEVRIQEQLLGEQELNKTYALRRINVPIQLEGELANIITFLDELLTENPNITFNEVYIAQTTKQTETGESVKTWNLRLQIEHTVMPYVQVTPQEAKALIYTLKIPQELLGTADAQ